MLVTFTSNAYENITYFGDVALRLLSLMGHSGTIPGAIKAEDIPEALERLQSAVSKNKGKPNLAKLGEDEEDEPNISLDHRALPLINMLKAAAKKDCDVLWST
jgi:hypothetical protein